MVLRHDPGALYRALAPLSLHGVNLSKIESRPSRRRAFEYAFYLELDGHASTEPVASALTALASACERVDVLGSYPRATLRSAP
jgi:chorismate mutase/prephenate dehydratase